MANVEESDVAAECEYRKKKEWQNGMKSFLWNIEVVEKRKEESALNAMF